MEDKAFAGIPENLRIGVCSTVATLYLTASVFTLTFNGLLLFVIYRDPLKCFRRPFAVLITGLAITDATVGAIGDTTSAKNEFYCIKNRDGHTSFDYVIDYFIDNSATVLVVALSVDRLTAVAFPFFYRFSIKNVHSVIVVISVWLYCLVFSLLRLSNIPEEIYDSIDVHLHVTFALSTTAVIYCVIYFIIPRRRKLFPGEEISGQKAEQHRRNLQRENEFAFTAFLILLVLVLTQIPYLVLTVIESNCESCLGSRWFFVTNKFSDFLLCVSSIANPFLYGWRMKQFRNSFLAIFCRSRLRQTDMEISKTATQENEGTMESQT
ncbi:dopamine receptor 1-like [Stylophora pistillata]|uniref:dopamine receptor 1-like n=1 Tax=Stylophora pistillata TaxID=50429 RepID=UPI000C057D04|nr:dopamine receptor 1-like [Stylophora pistillata]